MGRGIARKAQLTKKCCCGNPNWHYDDIEVNGNTKEITYVYELFSTLGYEKYGI